MKKRSKVMICAQVVLYRPDFHEDDGVTASDEYSNDVQMVSSTVKHNVRLIRYIYSYIHR